MTSGFLFIITTVKKNHDYNIIVISIAVNIRSTEPIIMTPTLIITLLCLLLQFLKRLTFYYHRYLSILNIQITAYE